MKRSINISGGIKRRGAAYGDTPGNRPSTQRPARVETRHTQGHYEMDTVMGIGSPDCIVTRVERKTGFVYIGKLADQTTAALNQKTWMLIRRTPTVVKTITADHGTEFHQYNKRVRKKAVRYFTSSRLVTPGKEVAMQTATA